MGCDDGVPCILAFTQGFWDVRWPIQCQSIALRSLCKKPPREARGTKRPELQFSGYFANSIHRPVWSSLKDQGKLLGDCSRL